MRCAFRRGDDIEQVVNPVAKIDVCPAAFLKHDFGASGAAIAEGMRGAVVGRSVSLRFGDAARRAQAIELSHENFAQQVAGNLHHIGADIKLRREMFAFEYF